MQIHLQALLDRDVVKNTGRVETPANRYGKGKTQEQSSEQTGSIGGEHNPGGKTKRDNPMHGNSPGRAKQSPNDKAREKSKADYKLKERTRLN